MKYITCCHSSDAVFYFSMWQLLLDVLRTILLSGTIGYMYQLETAVAGLKTSVDEKRAAADSLEVTMIAGP
jgi:hypothetical protein